MDVLAVVAQMREECNLLLEAIPVLKDLSKERRQELCTVRKRAPRFLKVAALSFWNSFWGQGIEPWQLHCLVTLEPRQPSFCLSCGMLALT